jgi:hypothetical protein
MSADRSSATPTEAIWWGDFYSPSFPHGDYTVVGHGYCAVYARLKTPASDEKDGPS